MHRRRVCRTLIGVKICACFFVAVVVDAADGFGTVNGVVVAVAGIARAMVLGRRDGAGRYLAWSSNPVQIDQRHEDERIHPLGLQD